MPITKSAIKKMRQDKKREAHNKKIKTKVKTLIKKALQSPSFENVKKAISALDKARKVGIYHQNKVSRLKSRLSKLAKPKAQEKAKTIKKPKKAKKIITVKKKA